VQRNPPRSLLTALAGRAGFCTPDHDAFFGGPMAYVPDRRYAGRTLITLRFYQRFYVPLGFRVVAPRREAGLTRQANRILL